MNSISKVEKLFNLFNETAVILQEELPASYLEALAETGENIFHGDVLQDELSEMTKKRLLKQYGSLQLKSYSHEDVRKGFQLAILKGMQENVQPNHQMTPDAVGMFVSYIMDKFMEGKKHYTLLDPVVGTGNLLFTILNNQAHRNIASFGVDIDDLLIRLAYVGANLQEQAVQLYNQDSLEPLLIDPVDAVVCDLPVGYYPNDVRAAEYELKADEGHSYAHHLLIEKSVNHVKQGGFLFLVIPNSLFESEEAPKLNAFITKEAYIQGLIQLPQSMFKNKAAAKSIFVLQKKAEGVTAPKNALLVDLPKFSNVDAMQSIMKNINSWFAEQKSK
ncbi:class I SAM-dependent methyltransferase [Peribacillus deserti]|uniref:SAM-dependent methyltransferase n=1 Tax=Peribacillus deserti TaxID=673318 RepID=A0A2N5M0E8_9BACI|nr:class I SAM-dependent methyltransferase [Peribacillus deserti]PLT27832.1 SAM-dependent methyltransferase [Peribacillus deserti]